MSEWDDLSRERSDRLEVAEHPDLHFGAVEKLLDQDLLVVGERELDPGA